MDIIQCSKKLKVLDKKRLLDQQNKQRMKYGLKARKRLDIEFITRKNNAILQTEEKKLQDEEILEGYA